MMTLVAVVVCGGGCQSGRPAVYETPTAAVDALVSAMKADDPKELEAVFGREGRDIVSSGDRVADRNQYAAFVSAFEAKHVLTEETDGAKTLSVGADDWPFPVPLVQGKGGWVFDSVSGRDEILNRRIGRNELSTIQVCLAIVDAQREYALMDADGDGLRDYARKLRSSEGKRDGLYWAAKEGERSSPMGPLVAEATEEGYGKGRSKGAYHGYRFRLLLGQGETAAGGEMDYVVNGKLLGGFAVVAWPAEYGNSGVMTFMVSHEGKVYQRDLGKQTAARVGRMKLFEPGGWEEVGG
jgi:hypothetical protein